MIMNCVQHVRAQPPELVRSGPGERTLAAQLHAVSKHLRKNPIGGATFAQALGSTSATKRAASCAGERQARRLALYIYWNVKGSADRCAPRCFLQATDLIRGPVQVCKAAPAATWGRIPPGNSFAVAWSS